MKMIFHNFLKIKNNSMKKFKQTDLWISIGLIVFFIVYNLLAHTRDLISDNVFMAYFVVGGWQVISMIVHAVTRTFTRPVGTRLVYHWISFIALATMPLGSFWILLFAAPFMALFYTWICYREIRKMNTRPLDSLR